MGGGKGRGKSTRKGGGHGKKGNEGEGGRIEKGKRCGRGMAVCKFKVLPSISISTNPQCLESGPCVCFSVHLCCLLLSSFVYFFASVWGEWCVRTCRKAPQNSTTRPPPPPQPLFHSLLLPPSQATSYLPPTIQCTGPICLSWALERAFIQGFLPQKYYKAVSLEEMEADKNIPHFLVLMKYLKYSEVDNSISIL